MTSLAGQRKRARERETIEFETAIYEACSYVRSQTCLREARVRFNVHSSRPQRGYIGKKLPIPLLEFRRVFAAVYRRVRRTVHAASSCEGLMPPRCLHLRNTRSTLISRERKIRHMQSRVRHYRERRGSLERVHMQVYTYVGSHA